MENRAIQLPNGVIIHTPYCLVVSLENGPASVRLAARPNSGCLAVFVHHTESLGGVITVEGIDLKQLEKDHNLERVWPIGVHEAF